MIRQLAVPPFELLDPFLPQARRRRRRHPRTGWRAILADVAARGDRAVRAWTRKLDGVDLAPGDVGTAARGMGGGARPASTPSCARRSRLRSSGSASTTSASATRASPSSRRTAASSGMRVTPLDRVGLYVPGGKAAYPSSVIMNAVPAAVAGVDEIIAVTPPAGVDRRGARGLRAGRRHPAVPDRRGPGDRRRWPSAPRPSRGWTRSWGRATGGWRRPSGRWRGRWGST